MADRRATFIQNYLPYAQEASALTGIDPGVILAQAAHETAWGRKAPGNNFFGIKGGGQTFATHEYIGGKRVNMKAGFRRYDDPRGSFLDWAKLMQTPRYAKVLAAKTPEEQIKALKAAGYATDPAYVSKLSNVRDQVAGIAGDALTSPAQPGDIGGIMDVASLNQAPSSVPDQLTAAQGYAPQIPAPAPAQAAISDMLAQPQGMTADQIDQMTMVDESGNYLNPPGMPPMPQPPPQWAQAGGFPMDEALTGRSAQDVLMGGPRMDPRRAPPGTGPMPPNMGAMRSPADVLAAGPNLRPGGAPDASMVPTPGISPMRPAVGGPNDRRPQPPNPPPRAQGIPDPRSNPRRDPFGFPIDVTRPRIANPDGSFSTERTITFDASEVGLPPEIVTVPTIVNGRQVSEDEARALFASGQNPPVQRGFDSFAAADQAAEARTGSIAAARATNGMREGMFPAVFGEQPGPPPPLTDADRQRILSDLADFRQRDRQTMVAGMPDIPRPAFQSRIAGRPEFPGAIQPPRNDVPELPPPSEPRVPASTALTPALMDRLRQAQGIGPFPSRPEFPGALPAAPNPYDDPSRQFDIPDPFTLMADSQPPPAPTPPPEARTKDDAYTPGRDFSIAAPAPLITQNIPPSPFGPTGNVVGPQDDAGSGRQPFIDANRAPTPIDSTTGTWSGLPDPTPPGLPSPPAANWRDQFNISFSPGGPGMIYDMTPPAPPPSSQAGNPFDALMGPGAAMGAVPFNDMAQGIGAPDFSAARPPSPFDSAPTSDLGLGVPPKPALMSGATAFYRPDAPDPTFAGGSVVSPNSPNAIGATDTQAMPGRIFVDPAKYGQPPTPPPSPVAQSATMGLPEPGAAPRQTNPGAERQRNGMIGRVLGGLLGGPLGALGGGLLGGGGGGFGFGQGATVTGMGPTFSAPYMQSNGQMGNTNVQRVQAGNMQGTMWNRNNGGSVGYVTDPFTGAMIHAGSPNTVGGGGLY